MSEMKKVKLLMYGTAFGKPGDIIEVPAQVADALCKARDHHNGYEWQKIYLACSLEEAEKMEAEAKSPANIENMSQAEAEAAGIQNVTPSDPSDIGEANKVAAAKKAEKSKKK